MKPSFSSFIKMEHYGKAKWLKFVSFLQLIASVCFLLLPLFVQLLNIQNKIILIFVYSTTCIIAIASLLNILQEYLIAKSGAVTTDHVKYIIRLILKVVLDGYDLGNDCRATLFIPSLTQPEKLIIYARLPSKDNHNNKCFFLKNQGVPGKAWVLAWQGGVLIS